MSLALISTGVKFPDGTVQSSAAAINKYFANVEVFVASGTWVCPAGVTEVWATGFGGSGGGGRGGYGGDGSNNGNGGAGGAGGVGVSCIDGTGNGTPGVKGSGTNTISPGIGGTKVLSFNTQKTYYSGEGGLGGPAGTGDAGSGGGSGGGGGGTVAKKILVVPGTTYNITIGAGGNAGGASVATAGGATSFGALLTLGGGGAGANGSDTNSTLTSYNVGTAGYRGLLVLEW